MLPFGCACPVVAGPPVMEACGGASARLQALMLRTAGWLLRRVYLRGLQGLARIIGGRLPSTNKRPRGVAGRWSRQAVFQ